VAVFREVFLEGYIAQNVQFLFLRHLLGITKLDIEKNQCIWEKNCGREHSKGNKTVPEKVATTRTQDAQK
jgi:hypothetical protein